MTVQWRAHSPDGVFFYYENTRAGAIWAAIHNDEAMRNWRQLYRAGWRCDRIEIGTKETKDG